ncbi:type II secretion system protein [Ruficoccus sp. ZRK36]|uniref:type II secretion system protein n=1 Tax=Ruficoccus sp. ZRK36 TaxID=2866311 RepID=UPI001C72AD5C|nr:type II secretion system protein [Ruficoccus sp. ZRK36]QYY35077.1 type II secretion system GspH family protein [Ruficoccus sp. ZRK36]
MLKRYPTPHTLYRRKQISGFSLIELLAVLAVIATLVAIIIPLTSTIRERASLGKCASNMRQLGQGIMLYQADNGGYLPPNWSSSGGSASNIWTVVVRPYMGIMDQRPYGIGTDEMCKTLSCPSLEDTLHPDRWWETNYAVGIAFGLDGARRTLTDVDTSKVIMLVENDNPSARCLRYTNGPWSYLGYNHGGVANVMFHDGHMAQWTEEDTPQDASDPAWGF